MKSATLLFFASFILLVSAFAGEEPREGPLNPAFERFIMNKHDELTHTVTDEGFGLGEIPSPLLLHFERLAQKADKSFPTSYDLRTVNGGGWLTTVKHQGSSGTCWAFATTGAIESYWLKIGKPVYDLSEQNMATCHGFDWGPNSGGNRTISTAYLTRRDGPVSEHDDPYTLPDLTHGDCTENLPPVAFVYQSRNLPGIGHAAFDQAYVKQAILDYGALYVNMRWELAYYNADDYTYNYTGSDNTNHAVLLVGWDDNKMVTGGTAKSTTTKGAWIIRNSWGTNWGEDGFFYISYEDTKTLTSISYWPSYKEYDPMSKIHYYDKYGAIRGYGWSSSGNGNAHAIAKFTAPHDEKIEKIGTFANAANAVLDIAIYKNFDGTTYTNLLGSLSGLTCEWPGYYTFDLNTPIDMAAGEDYYVKIKYDTGGGYPIPVEREVENYVSNIVIQSGKYWVSNHGTTSWFEFGPDHNRLWNVNIRAYTSFDGVPALAGVEASTQGPNSIRIDWTKNQENDPVMLVWAPENTFGTPKNGTSYTPGETIPGGGTVLYLGWSDGFTHDGLDPGTTYYYKAFSYDASSTNYSVGRTAHARTYTCFPLTALPFSEDFDASTNLPDCWDIIDHIGNGQVWEIGTHINGLQGTTGNYVSLNSDAFGSEGVQNTDLVTPVIDLSGYDDITLNFTHYFRQWSDWSTAKLSYSTNGGGSWIPIQVWTETTSNPAFFSQVIPDTGGKSAVQFKWNYSGRWGYYWNVDDVIITDDTHVPETRELVGQTVTAGETTCFDAQQTITTGGDGPFIVESGGATSLIAGKNIIMLPGTQLQGGSHVHAYITTNGNFCGENDLHFPETTEEQEVIAGYGPEPDADAGQDSEISEQNLLFDPLENAYFQVYPNPTQGTFTLELKGFESGTRVVAEVFGIRGETILRKELPVEQTLHSLSLEGKQPGVYFLRVEGGTYAGVQQIIKR